MLLNNSETSLSDKRDEPTVQCVFQATNNFRVGFRKRDFNNDIDPEEEEEEEEEEERWLSVSAKLYQAFLLLGGQSGRLARGDALIELDFSEAVPREFTS